MPRIPTLLLTGLTTLTAQDPGPRLDPGLADARQPQAVFVRFRSQWLGSPEDYAKHCAAHRQTPRRKQRSSAIARLKQLASQSWAQAGKRLASLEGVSAVQRYWLVNGFGCLATGPAARALATDHAVAFVYKKPDRVPGTHARQQRPGRSPLRLRRRAKALRAARDQPSPLPELSELQLPFNLERIQVRKAWQQGALGQGVVVALLDSGLLPTPALTQALWHNPGETLDGEDEDGNGLIDDVLGYDFRRGLGLTLGDSGRCHGSMCGGIIAARPSQVAGKWLATGIAPRAQLMVLRGMGDLRAYEYALQMGADVLSMSYMYVNIELGNWRGLYRLAHEHMTAAGLVSVGGSGNFAQRAPEGRQICLPKDIPCVISASGLNQRNELPAFSSLGPCTWDEVVFYRDYPAAKPLLKPDVTGFSMDFPVWSRLNAWPAGRRGVRHVHDAGDGCGLIIGARGNSFAGPHAAGVAALMLSAHPDLPAWRVKELMELSCRDLGAKGKDNRFGAGLLQAGRAVTLSRAAAKD